jgi:hypothetical protein
VILAVRSTSEETKEEDVRRGSGMGAGTRGRTLFKFWKSWVKNPTYLFLPSDYMINIDPANVGIDLQQDLHPSLPWALHKNFWSLWDL